MNKQKLNVLIVLILISISVTNCSTKDKVNDEVNNKINDKSYVEYDINPILETIGQEYSLLIFEDYEGVVQEKWQNGGFSKAVIENITYYIDKTRYTPEERTEIIYDVNDKLNILVEDYAFSTPDSLSVYIGDNITTQGIKGSIFINSDDLYALNSLVAMIAGFEGELVNYGLCYEACVYISRESNWNMGIDEDNINISPEQLSSYFSKEENLTLLDLSIPVFETIYFTEEDNLYAKATAYYLVQHIIEQYGINDAISLIKKSSELTLEYDLMYADRCNEWLLNINASCRRNVSESPVRCIKNYGRSKSDYEYVFYTQSMQSYIAKDHLDASVNIILTYQEIIKMLSLGEADLKIIKEYLSPYLNTEMKQINSFYYDNNLNYYNSANIVYVTPYTAFTHEYVHYITDGFDTDEGGWAWLFEGLATYVQYYVPGMLMDVYAENVVKSLKERKIEDILDLYSTYSEKFRNTQITVDTSIICDIVACSQFNNRASNDSRFPLVRGSFMLYQEAASLVNYLIKEYGADIFFSLFKNEITLEQAYGKGLDELYNEWGKYVTTLYGDSI